MRDPINIKDLKINDQVYAKYFFENGILYLKILIWFEGMDKGINEDNIAGLIGAIENAGINSIAYLNI